MTGSSSPVSTRDVTAPAWCARRCDRVRTTAPRSSTCRSPRRRFTLPPLTTVRLDKRLFAERTLELLAARIADRDRPPELAIIPHEVVRRESTAARA